VAGVPKMTYAADVWYMPIYKLKDKTRKSGSVTVTRKLTTIQRMATLAIMGALHTTATDILDLHANLLPVELLFHKVCQTAAVWMVTLPATHPLHKPFRQRAKHFIKTHCSPPHELVFIYDIEPDRFETSPPVRSQPKYETKFQTEVNNSAEGSIKRDKANKDEVRIYADGSGINRMAGAAAVIYSRDKPPKMLRYCLGPLTEHTTFEAEAVGITLGMHMLRYEKNVKAATISLDNQAVIMVTGTWKAKSGHYIIDEFLWQSKKKWRASDKLAYKLKVTWVKGHIDIPGNIKVDTEAKKAAGGKTSKAHNLPKYLTENLLPLSAMAVRQEYKRGLKKEWKRKWETSPRFLKLSQIDPPLLSNNFIHLTEGLWRTQASIIAQLHTGHIPLNHYLHRITKSNTPRCSSCNYKEETTHHYLFDCPTWRHKRWSMGKKLGKNAKSMEHILSKEKGIKEVLKYVGRTERFKYSNSEVDPTL
jgi:ribonuclease HI